MRRGRRRQDIFDQPWVPIAAVIGVIAVIAIAIFFFMGLGGSGDQAAGPSSPSTGSTPSASGTISTGIDPSQIRELPTVTVPAQGTFVKVSYLGSFSGEYGMDGEMITARDSGDRVYEIENANRTITAVFKKLDSSTKHDLTVEIWKDGKVMKFDTTTSPYGEVSVDYTP
jgi:hypothetical protein